MAARPWTPAHDDRLRDLHAAGKSLQSIAGELGFAKSTVSRQAKRLELVWDRAQTAQATRAKVADAKERRATLQLRLLEDAERLRAEMWVPHEYIDHGGRDYVEVRWTMPTPAIADKLKLMQSVGIAVDRSLKLADHDSDGAEQVRSLLGGIAEALGLTTDTPDA